MTVSSNLLPNGRQQFLDGDGKPYAGGQVFFYVPNTTTFKTTWQDAEKVSQNTNPVLLDANGEAIIFGDGVYRQVLKDAFGTTIWDTTTLQFVSFSGGDLEGNLPDPTLRSGVIAQVIEDAPSKSSIEDLDEFAILDSEEDFSLANVAWSVLKAAILEYLQGQTIFAGVAAPGAGISDLTVQVNSSTVVVCQARAVSVFNTSGEFISLWMPNVQANLTVSGAGGLDTGTEAANTWYYVYLIYNSTTQDTALILSTSSTGPTMPTGYDYQRRVGGVRNDAASNLWRTLQFGERTQIIVGTNPTTANKLSVGPAGSTSTPTYVALALASFVLPTATMVLGWVNNADSSAHQSLVAPNGNYGAVTSTTKPPPVASNQTGGVGFELLLETTSIYWAAATSDISIYVLGWEDVL